MHGLGGIFLQYFIAEIGKIKTPAATCRTLFTLAVAFDNDLQRQAHQRPYVGIHQAVAARHHHHFIFPCQARHHLRDARIEGARIAFQTFQQRHLVSGAEAGNGVMRQIQVRDFVLAPLSLYRLVAQHRHGLAAALACNGARGQGRAVEGSETDVVRVGECGFLAAYRTHSHALINTEAAGFDDAFFQRPALGTAILEIQIGIVNLVRQHFAEDLFQLALVQCKRGQQRLLRKGEYRIFLHRIPR